MKKLISGYSYEIDNAEQGFWYETIKYFKDKNIYQTWAYGKAQFGERNLSHIIVRKRGKVVGAAQVRIVRIPIINSGIAYVSWAPLWRSYENEGDLDDFRTIIRIMRQVYTQERGLFLRIIPNEIDNPEGELRTIFAEEGYIWRRSDYRTLYLNLADSLETIRSKMSKSWRRNLIKAEKNELSIEEGSEPAMFEVVDRLYTETVSRKGFYPGITVRNYNKMQEYLPDNIKMKIMICKFKGEEIAVLVGAAMGEVGIELIAATNTTSLKLKGSYLLRWKMLEYLKQSGCLYYNLNGINPERNPGGYQFKSAFCGGNGLDTEFLGTFEACENRLSLLTVKFGEMVQKSYRKIKAKIW